MRTTWWKPLVAMSAKHGMNIFRIFDCVNDPRNMETSIRAAKKAGAQAHGTICYTTSPVHTTQTFVDMGRELADMGADAIVIKDMAGLIPPYVTQELVSALKKDLNIPVWIHTHDTAGLGASTYLSAIDAGVDACDVSISPFANGTGPAGLPAHACPAERQSPQAGLRRGQAH